MLIGLACLVLIVGLLYELFKEQKKHVEAFTSGTSDYFSGYYPKRTDVLPGQTVEDGGWVRDLRYKEQYVDVQKIGLKADLCRVVMRRDDPGSMIMACALAGTDGTPSRNYKTKSKSEGFKFSRDDYFRDVNAEGRDDYCRIVKTNAPPQDQWASKCVLAGIDSFKPQEVKDNDPPKEIIDLLWFFEGIMLWYRFRDDIIDYAGNSNVALSGDMSIDQDPTKTLTEGLQINHVPQMLLDSPPPAEQFMRLGETKELEFESDVELRNLRAFSFWVHFDIFTNNARIFDFGNGAGHDNVFFGIEGSGNDTSPGKKKNTLTAQPLDDDAVCNRSAPREIAPAQYMKMTAANVELYECPGPEPIDPAVIKKEEEEEERPVKRANLLFEIWDKEQRKMRMRIVDAVQEQKWHHIAVTTVDSAFRPTWHVYIDGLRVFSKEEGHLPQTNYTTKNYIGRSNWEGAAGQGEYKDERFRGSLFDFRMYRIPMSEAKIQKTIEWGMVQIGVNIRSGPDTSGRVASAKAQKAKLDGQRKQLEADKKRLDSEKKSVEEQKQSVVAQQATLATQNKILAEKTQALKTQGSSTPSAKKGTPKSGKKGTPKSGSAKKGTPKSGKKGTPKSGSAKKGTPKSGSAKKGTPKSGSAKKGTPKSGAAKGSAAKGSAAKGSTPKSGAAKGSAAKGSTPKSGTAKGSAAKGSTPKSGTAKGSTPKNDAKASAKGSTPKATDKKKK